MIVTPVEHGMDLAPGDPNRAPGLHMSDLYNKLYQKLEPKRYKEDSLPAPALLGLGIALETYTERRLQAAGIDAHRPDPFRTPDKYQISFSPDLIISNGVVRGGEIKATFMSSREMPTEQTTALPPKFDKYITQMKSYGHNLEIPDWTLFVWHLKGKWEKNEDLENVLVDVRAFNLQFTKREMAEEYQMLINFGKSVGML